MLAHQVHGRPTPPRPDTQPLRGRLLAACWAGHEPAELLAPREREQLVYELWGARFTDAEVATHCRMTTYTAARIRARLGLPARRPASAESTG